MWSEGTLKIGDTCCRYWVKHYEEASEDYGIDGGRISKMTIEVDGIRTLNYDRGWDQMPEDEVTLLAYRFLIQTYN